MIEIERLHSLLEFAFHLRVRERRRAARPRRADQYICCRSGSLGRFCELKCKIVVDFALRFDAAGGRSCGAERGEE